ncbi:MAG: serine/threonine-protein kinase [Candidatus Brocadiia bacterium]
MDPQEFGKYTLLESVGKGGMGTVYRASDADTGRIVALKVFASDEERPAETSCRLRDREVRMLVSVQHPNVVKFFESGYVRDDYYYTMEFVEESLLRFMRSDRELPLSDKIHILRQSASALSAIHQQGIVHRDVKPGNILLDHDPSGAVHVKLTDLGIAKNVSEPDVVREQTHRRVPGTPKYLSPEQIQMRALDGRSDIFSLGVVAYEFLTGTPPFSSPDSRGYMKANIEQQPAPPQELAADIPPFVGDMVLRMLETDVEERYDSEALARDLELCHQHLISGAPLVEKTNPASMFYEEPPEPEEQESPLRQGVSPLSWGLAGGIVLAGFLVTALLWPAGPAAGAETGSESPGPRAIVETAVEEGRYWQAMALMEEAEADDDLVRRTRAALAERLYGMGQQMLQEGRREEAEVVLARLRELFPEAEQTASLGERMRQNRRTTSSDTRWQRELLGVTDLARRGRHREALETARRLHQRYHEVPERLGAIREATDKVLELWALALLEGKPAREEAEAFLDTVTDSAEISADGPPGEVMSRLRFRLAELYREAEDYRAALRNYDLAALGDDAELVRRATRAAEELRQWLRTQPVSAAATAEEVAAKGFLAELWEARGPQQVQDGVLRLGRKDADAARQTMRTVRNLGFRAGVEFRAGGGMLQSDGTARLGLALEDTAGRVFTTAFDGTGYVVGEGSGEGFAGTRGHEAMGDEAEAWHRLSLHYDFGQGRLRVLLGDKELAAYNTDLEDVRLRIFWEHGEDEVTPPEFRNVTFGP